MSNSYRIVVPGAPHHVTQRGNNRQIVFSDKDDYRRYLVHLEMDIAKRNILLHGYCLMQNHIHLILTPPSRNALSALMQVSSQRYARSWNQKRERSGHLWQSRFFSCPMDATHTYRALRYVELNPVRAKLVSDPCEYPWSSASNHCGLNKHESILSLEQIEGCWQIPEWKDFLQQNDDPQDLAELRGRTASSTPWGAKEFQQKHTPSDTRQSIDSRLTDV